MNPTTFGKYKIIRKLQGGGMGRVYLAADLGGVRQVALKLIDEGPDPDSLEVMEAERRGAILQAQLADREPRVVKIFDLGKEEGYFFIVMEYVEGYDLSEEISRGPLGVARAVKIARELCAVLQKAHTFRTLVDGESYHGIVHGDIKPRNIRLTTAGDLKVLDFGIAKALSQSRQFTRNQFGSVPYSSPERLQSGEVDAASDVWSVAIVLFEMLTGQGYFPPDAPGRMERAVRQYESLQPSMKIVQAGLRDILSRALSPNPAWRYPSAAALEADLHAYEAGRPVGATTAAAFADAVVDDATRRTVSADPGDDATRRTASPLPRPAVAAPPPVPPLRAIPKRTTSTARRLMQGALTAVLLIAGINEIRVYRQGSALQHDIDADGVTDLNSAWQRYEKIVQHSYLPVVLTSPRHSLRDKFVSTADLVINQYRDDQSTVRERNWQDAKTSLLHALELNGDDKTLRGKLRLCEGHLARINAKGGNLGRSLTEARTKFEESASLLKKSPDPHLGLARLYIENFKDLAQGENELREAEKHGYRISKRENAQLAGGYRDRADQAVREATQAQGLPQEQDQLRHAIDDYQRAIDLYGQVGSYGNALGYQRRAIASKEATEARLQQMQGGAVVAPVAH